MNDSIVLMSKRHETPRNKLETDLSLITNKKHIKIFKRLLGDKIAAASPVKEADCTKCELYLGSFNKSSSCMEIYGGYRYYDDQGNPKSEIIKIDDIAMKWD